MFYNTNVSELLTSLCQSKQLFDFLFYSMPKAPRAFFGPNFVAALFGLKGSFSIEHCLYSIYKNHGRLFQLRGRRRPLARRGQLRQSQNVLLRPGRRLRRLEWATQRQNQQTVPRHFRILSPENGHHRLKGGGNSQGRFVRLQLEEIQHHRNKFQEK